MVVAANWTWETMEKVTAALDYIYVSFQTIISYTLYRNT